MPTRRLSHIVHTIVLLGCGVSWVSAQEKVDPLARDIEITINSSRPQVPAGSGFGVAAEIRNKSAATIYLHPKFFTMTPPPEIDPGTPNDWWAVIPAGPAADPNDSYEKVVPLGPGDHTTAFWAGGSPGPSANATWLAPLWRELSLLNFSPGEYTIKVVGMYWKDMDGAFKKSKDYRTETASLKVLVVAPQWVILLGAMVGGLVAYFLLPSIRLTPNKIDFFGLLTASLLSSIVTILLARLSETQFLIRITINDFWGAIAMGFIASSSGVSILKRFSLSQAEKETKRSADGPDKDAHHEQPTSGA